MCGSQISSALQTPIPSVCLLPCPGNNNELCGADPYTVFGFTFQFGNPCADGGNGCYFFSVYSQGKCVLF